MPIQVIPEVFAQDVAWFGVVAVLYAVAAARGWRRAMTWLFVMGCYVITEMWLHVPMEQAAAWIMGRL